MSSPMLWYATRATGIVALVLLSATVVLGLRTAGRRPARRWPAFAEADLHRRLSVIALVFLALHVLTAVVDTYVHVGWASIVVPFVSGYQPFWTGLGTVALDLVAAVGISSALRQRISAPAWRAIHWLAYLSWPVAVAHSVGMGTDVGSLWADAVLAVCLVAVLAALGRRVVEGRSARATARRVGAVTRAPLASAAAPRSVTATDRRPAVTGRA